MISALNHLVDLVEAHLADPVEAHLVGEPPIGEFDVESVAGRHGTTGYHLRRMFSSLAGMPLSEYVRRRRMTVAAAAVVRGEDDLLTIAVRSGYGSTEAFGRAFRAVHGAGPGEVRRDGGPLRSQPQLRFRLTVEGNTRMDTRIVDRPAFTLVGHATRVPLIHHGVNPHIQQHIAALPAAEHQRLKTLSDTEPAGILQVSDDLAPDDPEGSELTYLHGVAIAATGTAPDDLDVIEVPAGRWAVFRTAGPYPQALQATWAATAAEWFPSNPWRLRPGPSIVAVVERAADFSTATCELWLPVEPG
ncbi:MULTISPECIES: AraC family transcriptional regulator [unclassified Solwaraspora]|uniref:AraC family transcriptional regulator n=1 Tax=unclassified Solwaraspora TaxID=2627926 RepID=UPI00259B1F58|nr:GyrI-like domain-containing protein [Solwaraspora sp. WMMA2056]WJK42138.1 GyrI-like domain-containing protein [Solwaraspora sp. WMMA2056]